MQSARASAHEYASTPADFSDFDKGEADNTIHHGHCARENKIVSGDLNSRSISALIASYPSTNKPTLLLDPVNGNVHDEGGRYSVAAERNASVKLTCDGGAGWAIMKGVPMKQLG